MKDEKIAKIYELMQDLVRNQVKMVEIMKANEAQHISASERMQVDARKLYDKQIEKGLVEDIISGAQETKKN